MGFNVLVILGCILSLICWRLINGSIFRVLQKKFGAIPPTIIEKIRATRNSEQLEQWSVKILFVNRLEEIGIEQDITPEE